MIMVFFFLLVVLVITGFTYMQFAPQFGSPATKKQKIAYELSEHFQDGKFRNLEPFKVNLDVETVTAMLRKAFNPPDDIRPSRNLEVDPLNIAQNTEKDVLVSWLGHSSFHIQLDGKHILIDPIFSNYAAPHPWLGQARYSQEMPIKIEELPFIDFVIISHDHYDHLDYASIKQLLEKTGMFLVPLGVGNHLRGWGAAHEIIRELDWWQEAQFEEHTFIFTPSQHMSGRRLTDQSSTLWGSWVIQGRQKKIFFSGDSGYGKHFSLIGERYGPFDLALMECGQYDELWPDVHMTPEQTVQAGLEVRANLVIPIHWAAFTLANHGWTDPIVRVTNEGLRRGLNIATPKIGETVLLSQPNYPKSRWWEDYLYMGKAE